MNASSSATATAPRLRPAHAKQPRSLAANVRRGAIWSFAGTLIFRFSSVGITAIVAHILSPHDFGVFAVAATVYTIVSALGEFGVTSCLARADLDAESLAPTLWSVSLASSLLIAGVLYKFATPISASLGSQDAGRPVQVMSIVMVIWGLSAVPTAQCVRDFRQDTIFWADALSFVPGTITLFILAKHGDGAMAYAWSRVVGQAVSCAVILFSVPKLHLPGMTRNALSVLFRVGLPLACANFIGYILRNVDYALIGRLIGPIPLGIYVLAFNAASWSTSLLSGVLITVSMPAFSRVKDDAVRLRAAMADGIRAVSVIAAPMCMMVMVLARPFVLTLYGNRWASSATVLSILSLYGLISVAGVLFSNMLAALGRSKFVLVVQLIWLVGLIPAMWIGVHEDGIVGAAIAHIVIIVPVVLPCYLIALKRATGVRVSLLAKAAFPSLAVAVAAACLAWCIAFPFSNPLVQLTVGGVAGGSLYVVVMAPQLISLVMRGRALPPKVNKILVTYYRTGRKLGLPMAPPPQPAARRRPGASAPVRQTRPQDFRVPPAKQTAPRRPRVSPQPPDAGRPRLVAPTKEDAFILNGSWASPSNRSAPPRSRRTDGFPGPTPGDPHRRSPGPGAAVGRPGRPQPQYGQEPGSGIAPRQGSGLASGYQANPGHGPAPVHPYPSDSGYGAGPGYPQGPDQYGLNQRQYGPTRSVPNEYGADQHGVGQYGYEKYRSPQEGRERYGAKQSGPAQTRSLDRGVFSSGFAPGQVDPGRYGPAAGRYTCTGSDPYPPGAGEDRPGFSPYGLVADEYDPRPARYGPLANKYASGIAEYGPGAEPPSGWVETGTVGPGPVWPDPCGPGQPGGGPSEYQESGQYVDPGQGRYGQSRPGQYGAGYSGPEQYGPGQPDLEQFGPDTPARANPGSGALYGRRQPPLGQYSPGSRAPSSGQGQS